MVIRRSTAPAVSALLADLEAGDEAARERALARLSVIGTRAVAGLIALARSAAPASARLAALAALESIGDARAAEPALDILEGSPGPALALAAAGVLRGALDSPRGTAILDRLTALALDPARDEATRLAALQALEGLPPGVLEPVRRRLRADPSAAVRAAVSAAGPGAELDPRASLEAAAASGSLPADPAAIRRWLTAAAPRMPLPVLHRLVERVRAKEAACADRAARLSWMTARAAIHVALADRGSRVALYDLRETIESPADAPVEMLTALEAIGDSTCLETIAAAYARLSESAAGSAVAGPANAPDAWWRQHLRTAFATIVARERITGRHAVARRIRARWPEASADLLGPVRAGR